MAKQSNPLKFFNDKRAEKVAKLTKAQEGIQTKEVETTMPDGQKVIITPTPEYMRNMLTMDMPISNRDYMSKKEVRKEKINKVKEKVKEAVSNVKSKIAGDKKSQTNTSSTPMFKKQGGQIKSKKK